METSKVKTLIHTGIVRPYMSSWLVILEVIKWNRLKSYSELKNYLHPDSTPDSLSSLNDVDNLTMFIDFHMRDILNSCSVWEYGGDLPVEDLESAMGLESGVLKYSFLDAWFPITFNQASALSGYGQRTNVRHCPECIKAGYHSVIFYFERIMHCPWHGHALESCRRCTNILNYNLKKIPAIADCPNPCSHLSVVLGHVAKEELEPRFFKEVDAWCASFFGWVKKSVSLIGFAAYEAIVINTKSDSADVSIVLDYLMPRIGFPGFPHDVRRDVVMFLLRRFKLITKEELGSRPGNSFRNIDHQLSYYLKSVRRHIFKRYVRSHKKCFNRLKNLRASDWYSLNAEAICPCVLAYILITSKYWHTDPFDFFHKKVSLDISNNCESRAGYKRSKISLEYEPMEMLVDFYKHWDNFRSQRIFDSRCTICINRFENLRWVCNPRQYRSGLVFWFLEDCECHFFMEKPLSLEERGMEVCRKRLIYPMLVSKDKLNHRINKKSENVLCAIYNPLCSNVKNTNLEL